MSRADWRIAAAIVAPYIFLAVLLFIWLLAC